jgi:hypothetical protein
MRVLKSADRRLLVLTYFAMKTCVINTHPLKQFPSIAKKLKKNGAAPLLFHFGIDVEFKGVALFEI